MYLQTQTQHWLDPSRGSIEGGIAENIQYLPLVEKKPVREGSNERSELLNLLRGQRVQLPDLHKIFEGWPEAINDHVDALRIVVGADLDKYEPGRADSEACKASNTFTDSYLLESDGQSLRLPILVFSHQCGGPMHLWSGFASQSMLASG